MQLSNTSPIGAITASVGSRPKIRLIQFEYSIYDALPRRERALSPCPTSKYLHPTLAKLTRYGLSSLSGWYSTANGWAQ